MFAPERVPATRCGTDVVADVVKSILARLLEGCPDSCCSDRVFWYAALIRPAMKSRLWDGGKLNVVMGAREIKIRSRDHSNRKGNDA